MQHSDMPNTPAVRPGQQVYRAHSCWSGCITGPGVPVGCSTVLLPLSQLAANFLNDMWETTLSLRHPANFLAAGALYCAIKITKTDVPLQEGGKSWCAALNGPSALLEFEILPACSSCWVCWI
jgi:hypothetical protein